jgi:NADH-quinone oxidoreductase subunit K
MTATAVVPLSGVPLEHGLLLAAVLFCIGLAGLMVRRNFLFMLMSLEVMMNACALAFVAAGSRWVEPDGQIMFILILTLAAAEASIGLALVLQLYRRFNTLDIDAASEMRG